MFGAFVALVREGDSSAAYEERVVKHIRARTIRLENAQGIMASLSQKLNDLHAKVVSVTVLFSTLL